MEKYNSSQLVNVILCILSFILKRRLVKNIEIKILKHIIKMRHHYYEHNENQIKWMTIINLWLWFLRCQEVRVSVTAKHGGQACMRISILDFSTGHKIKHYTTDWEPSKQGSAILRPIPSCSNIFIWEWCRVAHDWERQQRWNMQQSGDINAIC